MERLDKLVAVAANCTRKEAQALIRGGGVTVTGAVCVSPEIKFEESVPLTVGGRDVFYRRYVYIMQNKAAGVISATENKGDRRPTVIDVLPPELKRKGLFPAGRLDADTTGFVLITDDGDFAHRILAPNRHVAKIYTAVTDRPPCRDIARRFEEGVRLADGSVCRPAGLTVLSPTSYQVVLHEGMYHQIKRMFAACGAAVVSLHRSAIGGLELDPDLAFGESRILCDGELRKLLDIV